jgi:hypothetical protein
LQLFLTVDLAGRATADHHKRTQAVDRPAGIGAGVRRVISGVDAP